MNSLLMILFSGQSSVQLQSITQPTQVVSLLRSKPCLLKCATSNLASAAGGKFSESESCCQKYGFDIRIRWGWSQNIWNELRIFQKGLNQFEEMKQEMNIVSKKSRVTPTHAPSFKGYNCICNWFAIAVLLAVTPVVFKNHSSSKFSKDKRISVAVDSTDGRTAWGYKF